MEQAILYGLVEGYHVGLTQLSRWLMETVATTRNVHQLLGADPRARGIVSARGLCLLGDEILHQAERSRKAPDRIKDMIIILEGDIRNRREASRWQRGSTTATTIESDVGHRAFIHTLEYVLEKLRTVRKDYGPVEVTSTEATPVEPQPNCFTALSIENTSEAFTVSFEVNLDPQSKTPQLATFDLDTGESRSEKLSLALTKHFETCQTARKRLQASWRDYLDGNITLKTASSVTNAVMSLLGRAYNMIADEYPECKGSAVMVDMLKLRFVVEDGRAKTMDGQYAGFVLGEKATQRANLYCLPAWTMLMLLNAYQTGEARRELGAAKPDIAKLIECHPTGRIFSKILTDFDTLASAKRTGRWADSLDIFTSDMLEFITSRTIDVSFLVNFQIQMDVFDIIGENRTFETPLDLWQYIWNVTSRGVDDFYIITKELQREIVDVKHKTTGQWLQPETDVENVLPEQCAMVLCSRLPVLAGSYHWSVVDHIQRCGLRLCDFEKVAVAIAHLYRVYQKRGLIVDRWEDMERFIEMQGADRLQLRDIYSTPTPMRSAARNYGLAMGVPPAKYTAYDRQPLPNRKSDSALKLQQASSWLKCIGTTKLNSQNLASELQNLMHHIITTNVVQIPKLVKQN